jgi:hypothetical protein
VGRKYRAALQRVSSVMRYVMAILFVCLATACGGGSSSPTGPSATAAPPPPTYPNMIAGWDGSYTYTGTVLGTAGSGNCRVTWVITSQNGGDFLGTFQTSAGSGATPCAQSGTVNGIVTSSSTITDIVFSANINPLSGCTRTQRTAYAGVLTGATLSAQTTETLSCSGVGTVNRSFSLTMTRR